MNDDDLRENLELISDRVRPVDLLDRSLARSNRLGRNRAIVACAAITAVLVVGAGVVAQLQRPVVDRFAPTTDPSASASSGISPAPSMSASAPGASPGPSVPPSASSAAVPSSVPGLPGWLYYRDGFQLLRLTAAGPVPLATARAETANVSPDGSSVAFYDGRNIVVADRDGRNPRPVFASGSGPALWYEPAWSPDSRRLLVPAFAANRPVTFGILTLASGAFTPLPHPLERVGHFLWSADGRRLGYATSDCRLGTADPDGGNNRVVPVFGTDDPANPRKRQSCNPFSISPDGRYLAVDQRVDGEPLGDFVRTSTANTIVDTVTGANVPLPVTGTVTQILFRPDGGILVRARTGGTTELTLLNPDRSVRSRFTEPVAVQTFQLFAHAS